MRRARSRVARSSASESGSPQAHLRSVHGLEKLPAATRPNRLELRRERCAASGGCVCERPLAVDPVEPVHLVRCAEARGVRALSIHIYSRPFDTCEIYCPDRGIYMDMKLTYWSQFGKVCS